MNVVSVKDRKTNKIKEYISREGQKDRKEVRRHSERKVTGRRERKGAERDRKT